MKVDGSYTFKSPPDRVWEVMLDPEALKSAIPGCESMELIGDDEYKATLKVGIAGIKGTYTGKVKITDQQPPNSYRMSVEGQGSAGFVKGSGLLALSPAGTGQTLVKVDGDAQVGGTIANVGQRLLGGALKMMMGQFFGALEKRM